MDSPWRLREGFATSSRALRKDVAGAEGLTHTHGGFVEPSLRLREALVSSSFGNDSWEGSSRNAGGSRTSQTLKLSSIYTHVDTQKEHDLRFCPPGGQALSRNDDEHRCVSSLSSTPGSSRVAKHLGCPQRQENTAFPYRVS